jgi:hypothetical protein
LYDFIPLILNFTVYPNFFTYRPILMTFCHFLTGGHKWLWRHKSMYAEFNFKDPISASSLKMGMYHCNVQLTVQIVDDVLYGSWWNILTVSLIGLTDTIFMAVCQIGRIMEICM